MAEQTFELDMQEMKIRYGGGNEIEANTYINSLIHFTNIVQEVNSSISKEKKVEVKIIANKEGSFIVDIFVISSNLIDVASKIFTKENASHAIDVINTVSSIFTIAQFLKGKKPKKITNDKDTTITIENNDGEVNIFDFRGANIYLNNPVIKEAVAQEFETLEADPNVTELQLLDKQDKPVVSIDRKEFYNISSSGSTPDLQPDEQVITVEAVLNISSLDLEMKKKWDFYYLGNKISAKIEDTNNTFKEKIDKGERFGKGDTLDVKMEITKKYDAAVNALINKSYKVIEIVNHKERPEQGKLDF